MTNSIRRLLAQIATFEAQSKAGLTPLPGELIEFFETAREARRDVRALDSGMLPPEQKAPRVSPAVFIPIDTIGTRRAAGSCGRADARRASSRNQDAERRRDHKREQADVSAESRRSRTHALGVVDSGRCRVRGPVGLAGDQAPGADARAAGAHVSERS
jgi:hypothetical protein